jgi:hypothetical protein
MKLMCLAGAFALALSSGCIVQEPAPAQPAQPTTSTQPAPPTDPNDPPPADPTTPTDPAPPVDPAPSCDLNEQLPARCTDGDADCSATAKQYNDEGKELWLKSNDLASAQDKFLMAFGMTGAENYGFNWCYALHQLGNFECAQYACTETLAVATDEQLRKKTQLVLDDIAQRLPQN